MTIEKLLGKTIRLLGEVECQSSGCYAPHLGGHRPACIRGRAKKLAEEIGWELERRRATGASEELGLK
jgi:hypothetical protein